MATDARNLTQGDSLGPYRIEHKLGEGGMGAVFLGRHDKLGRRVAIKVMFSELAANPEARERFLREGRAAARLEHPNVVYVSDVDVEGEIPYLVMEYLEGEDLRSLVKREGALSIDRAASLLVPIMRALSHAHRLGIVHRDLKPENLFLARQPDGSVVPKILDFGISKVIDANEGRALTATTALMGTPHYMSPEQAQGAKLVTAASDQYTIGVILYELVTGRKPFEEDALFPLLNAIVQGQFARAAQVRPELHPQLDAVISKAMALQTSERFASVHDFADALEAFAPPRLATPSAYVPVDVQAPTHAQYRTPEVAAQAALPTPAESPRTIVPTSGTRGKVVAFGLGLGLVALIVGALQGRSSEAAPAEANVSGASLPSMAPAKVVAPVAPVPSHYEVTLESEPADALFMLDGAATTQLGTLRASFARDGRTHEVSVSAEGYLKQHLTFVDQPPASSHIKLERAPVRLARPSDLKARPTARDEEPKPAPKPVAPSAPEERKPLRPGANNSPILDAP